LSQKQQHVHHESHAQECHTACQTCELQFSSASSIFFLTWQVAQQHISSNTCSIALIYWWVVVLLLTRCDSLDAAEQSEAAAYIMTAEA
jgi:hypothetical protein